MKTNNDYFVEQLIRRSRGGAETLVKTLFVLAGIIILAVLYWFFTSIWTFFLAAVCILEFFAFNYTRKEFEYSFINGDVDVDKISGKRRRKNVLSISCREITHMAPCGASIPSRGENVTLLDFSINRRSPGLWYFTAEREDGTNLLVLFNPNDRLREAFKRYLGKKMEYELPVSNNDATDDRS